MAAGDEGGDRRSEDFKRQTPPFENFSQDTAAKTGIAARTIRQSIRRAVEIDAKVRDRIREIPEIADSGVELAALDGRARPRHDGRGASNAFCPDPPRLQAAYSCPDMGSRSCRECGG